MKKLKIYIPCCDETLPVVKINSYLFNKFWPEAEVNYLGFKKPDFKFYNSNHKFYSMAEKQEGGSSRWTRYIYDFLKNNVTDSHIIFSLDDFWLCEHPKLEGWIDEFEKMCLSNPDVIGRFDLTFDSQVEGNFSTVQELKGKQLLVKNPGADYRVSTQPAIWTLKYLLELLDHDWNPWQFEILGNKLAHEKYPEKYYTFAVKDSEMAEYPLRTIAKGAYSRHNAGKFNVLGLRPDTIKELVEQGFFKEEELIWGQWQGKVPTFYELGGYDFKPDKMPYHAASKTNWKEYESVYSEKKQIVNLFDNTFSHTKQLWSYISANGLNIWGKPKKVDYILQKQNHDGITLFVDDVLINTNLIQNVKSNKKVGWIIEPRDVKMSPYRGVEMNHDKFDLIVTYDKDLINKYDNCKHLVWCESRVPDNMWGIKEKSKMVSMIASKKTMTPGHRYRFEIAQKLANKHNIDLWGEAFRPFMTKMEPLGDYMFSITVHNSKQDSFFTEALCDCFALGTIPIFRGCSNIGDFFDINGIITFDTVEELDEILKSLTIEDYKSRKEAIKNNFEICQKFRKSVDDQIIEMIMEYFKDE